MLLHTRITSLLAVAVILITAGPVSAQSTSATVSGTVKDVSAASVPNAKIVLTDQATRESRTFQTNEGGLFVAPDVNAGVYDVTVEKAGFRTLTRKGVVVSPQARLSLGEILLEVGSTADSLTVTADAGQLQLQADSGERSAVVTNTQLRDLALNGRSIHDLAKLIPGVAQPGGNTVQSSLNGLNSYSINGLRTTMKDLSIDGSSITRTDNQAQQVTINPDAVGEIKILTSNYQAEFGKAAGGIISVTTRQGSKDFHFSARYFRRHDSLNADSFFNKANGRPRNLYRYNYYGYDVGGPIYLPKALGGLNRSKDKLFFFWSQEYYRQLLPQGAQQITVPTAAERNGDFSKSVDGDSAPIIVSDTGNCLGHNTGGMPAPFPGNMIPKSCWFPGSQALLTFMPLPNTTVGGDQYNYTSQLSSKYPRREDIARVDYLVNSKTKISGHFINNYDDQVLSYGTTTLNDNFPIGPVDRSGSGYNFALTMTNTFSPSLINETIFGHGIFNTSIQASTNAFSRAATGISTPLLFPNANKPYDVIPDLTFDGRSNQNGPSVGINGSPFFQHIPSYNIIDNVTKVLGKHTFKAGVYYYKSTSDNTPQSPAQSSIDFSTSQGNDSNFPLDSGDPFANALLGVFANYNQASAKVRTNSVFHTVESYVQDSWRATSRLTFDLGLRFSYLGPLHDTLKQEGYFVPSLYKQSAAVRLYSPVMVDGDIRAVDPGNVPTSLTVENTLPNSFLELIVPNSGNATNGLAYAKDGYLPGGYRQGVRIGPRVGFAWSPQKETVVRGGFGISYDRNRADQTNDEAQVPPNVLVPQLFFGSLANINPANANGARAVTNLSSVSPSDRTPGVYSFSLGVQRNIGQGFVLDVAYVGSLGRNLLEVTNLNAIPYGTTFKASAQDPSKYANGVVPAVQPNLPVAYARAGLAFSGSNALSQTYLRPYVGYGDINYRTPGASSNYNSLQVSLNRHLSSSLEVGAAYTFSRNFVVANSDNESVNPFNTRAYDYRLSGSDQTHNLVVSYVYTVPGASRFLGGHSAAKAVLDGWELSGISIFRTGTPTELSPSISGINSAQRLTGSYSFGPGFYERANPLISAGVDGSHIDPTALYVANPGNPGPWPRTYLRNPGTENFDISVFKNFRFSSDVHRYLQLRLEMFNAFNHVQFSGYNLSTNLRSATGSTGSSVLNVADYTTLTLTNNIRPAGSKRPLGSYFGEYNGARDPRIIQLAAKFYF